ncbi:hypothetical protein [Actinomadura rudentiformis]|uniref:hypothetical protein n=1 Tax=Actinomadura rudentiformis TaxID=359158 RepID=UPI00178C7987|nr:hypothetical protein [Actinomadura rudentiformis]
MRTIADGDTLLSPAATRSLVARFLATPGTTPRRTIANGSACSPRANADGGPGRGRAQLVVIAHQTGLAHGGTDRRS